jgi:hypothetical protein
LWKRFSRFVVRINDPNDWGKSTSKYDKVLSKAAKKFVTASRLEPQGCPEGEGLGKGGWENRFGNYRTPR